MQGPLPVGVTLALAKWIKWHFREASIEERTTEHVKLLGDLVWDPMNGCYFFIRNGMYHGVELDGHIHT